MGLFGRKPHSRPASTITVRLIVNSQRDLTYLRDKTRLSTADIVNRAITLYAFAEQAKGRGGRLYLKERNNAFHEVNFR